MDLLALYQGHLANFPDIIHVQKGKGWPLEQVVWNVLFRLKAVTLTEYCCGFRLVLCMSGNSSVVTTMSGDYLELLLG
jgi:hypothetical protein